MYFESVDLESDIKKHIYSEYLNELNSYIQDNRERVEQEKIHLKGDEFKL